MSVIKITKENYQEAVLNEKKKVLLDFWAPWCGPCRMVSPILDEIAAERPDIKVCKVNIDEEYDLASRYKVVSIPTLLVMEHGQEEDRLIGARPKEQLLELFGY